MTNHLDTPDTTIITDPREGCPSWWEQVQQTEHPAASLAVRLRLFLWVASMPSIVIMANIVTKRSDFLDMNHLAADLFHFALCSVWWPIAIGWRSPHAAVGELLLLQTLVLAAFGWHYLAKTRAKPVTFRHLMPTAIAFSVNSLFTWVIGVPPA